MIIDIRQRLVDLCLVVSSLNDPWINFYRIPGYDHYVVWLLKDCIAVTKDLFIIRWDWGNTISTSVDPYKFNDFFEAEAQIKYIVRRYKELQLELKQEKIREKLKDLEKDLMMIDEKIEKPLLDLGLVKGYSDTLKQYYRLPLMNFHLIWVYYEDGRCSVPNDLFGIDGSIVTSVGTRSFNTVSDAIPFIKGLIRKYKELLVRLKKRELEQDFENG